VATYVTSFVCTESTIPNRWVRTHARTFAMVAIANPQCACSLVLSPPASSPYTNLAALVRRHSAGPLKLFETPKTCLSPRVGRICDAFGSAGLHRIAARNSALLH
jgi:hypothetical protein